MKIEVLDETGAVENTIIIEPDQIEAMGITRWREAGSVVAVDSQTENGANDGGTS